MDSSKLLSVFTVTLVLVSTSVQAYETKKILGLKMPESAIAATDGRVFVSEIGEFGKDGDGQITVIDQNG